MKKTILLFFIFMSINCLAQFSKTHYIPPIAVQNNLVEDQYLYISTPNSNNVNFKIIENGGNIITGSVSKNSPSTYPIGSGNTTQLITPKTLIGKISNKGYIIEAEDLIYVSVRVNASRNPNGSYNHAGGLVSKGNSALGKEFRLGAMLNPNYDTTILNFASILATENGTNVTISNIPAGTILSDGTVTNGPINVVLNKNESYVLALENIDNAIISNSSKMIGALVVSDKPVVVNSGSFCGSNSTALNGQGNPSGRDLGFDQIVPYEKTGTEYLFVKGNIASVSPELERVLLIAHLPNTLVYLNGSSTAFATLVNAGDYIDIDGNSFDNGNLYVKTSEKVFAYQSTSGSNSPANQNLFFVPPINCSTPNVVDNIPSIESIGSVFYSGGLNIVTETGATVLINNSAINSLPVAITGNPNFVRYSVNNLIGDISVKSTRQVYVSYYGTNGAATYGGYYSGFDTKPEIVTDKITVSNSACIPNVILKINTLSSYDSFQWYLDDTIIPGATTNSYRPTTPGFYQVKGSITNCPTTVPIFSDKIPVSNCPTNNDNDLAHDNLDIDNDNDGITNCTESFGNANINLSNPASGTLSIGDYSNSFNGTFNNSASTTTAPFIGNTDGSFITEVASGKANYVSYKMSFTKPITIGVEYVSTASPSDLLNPDAEYIINSDIDKTITVLNPTDQLLIDTNYDGIYESGVTEYSSFEIRFRLKSTSPLPAGTGNFKFATYLTNTIRITHKNLSDVSPNKSTFKIFAICVPKDSDGDGVPDQLDLDSDNDGIPDTIEGQGSNYVQYTTTDANKDGLSDAYGNGIEPIDTDTDNSIGGAPDYLDLDSDNDGIYDVVESGSAAIDSNFDGIIDGTASSFGINGLANSLESFADSGILNYTVNDFDADGKKNYVDLDSDNDGCFDVIEAGFTDDNSDGILGNSPVTVNKYGVVSSSSNGYTIPNSNYLTASPIIINQQPIDQTACELQDVNFTIDTNSITSYQWQQSTDGITWVNLLNNSNFNGTTTSTLTIKTIRNAQNNFHYRVLLNKNGNSCGLTSSEAILKVNTLPNVNVLVTLIQCDDDADGSSSFNLTEKNNSISSNYSTETFTYFNTVAAATSNDISKKITTPLAYISPSKSIWVRIENSNGCYTVSQLDLVVSSTQIPQTFNRKFDVCDDTIDLISTDTDGIATFDFSSVTQDIQALLPSPASLYEIKYYANDTDALAEQNEIINISNYRNTESPFLQNIWVRVESTLDNSCYGLGPNVTLKVNPKPNINTNEDKLEDELVCSNLSSFFVTLNSGIQDGTPESDYTYKWFKDAVFLAGSTSSTLQVNAIGDYTVEVMNHSGCSRLRTVKVTASDIAQLSTIEITDLSDTNSVRVIVTGQGNYEYGIDTISGPYQDSNFFDNLAAGIHEIYINDKNGCGIVQKTIAILGVPKFFTPNNDGSNDYWNVKGVNTTSNAKSLIHIFDRYGKLIKQINPMSIGWDGTFNGIPLPADDYWYTVKLEDGREAKGHFSLKR
ncbi:T9SS type B sorting domain-containing protein [Flavobacterium sp. W21_SRS_FM7]|uniref:T9SS type B sorting domain-containing protein n=2 Tax=unclassified Flavobacterium TaxID=196869 RepID=UPI003F8EB95F